MESEGGSSPEVIRRSADNQYAPQKRLQKKNHLISRN
jgi:hypothetical protein